MSLKRLAPYLPMDRRQALASGASLPDRATGAVLLADISGFTQITRRLLQQHEPKRAAEEVTVFLNRVFTALVAEVDAWHGSVIAFSGDAIACWFDGDDGRRAVFSALGMTAAASQMPAVRGMEDLPIAVKAGVDSGHVRRFLVGDPDIQVYEVLAGKLVDRLGEALETAGRGEVLVSPELVKTLSAELVLGREHVSRSDPFVVVRQIRCSVELPPSLPPPEFSDEIARPWLPRRISERLANSASDFLAEVRPVVVLFLRFKGPDYTVNQSGELLDAYIRTVQHILQRFEGDLLEITTGDKGSYLYIGFGATLAHQDDHSRAIAAALALRNVSATNGSVGIHPQIGISAGEMRAGAYGSETRRSYGVEGPDANIAARLMMKAAPGEILVTGHVVKRSSQRYEFADRGEMQLKGVEQPVSVYAALGEKEFLVSSAMSSDEDIPLLGRESERAAIQNATRRVAEGESRVIVIEGRAGIGKSRLLADLAQQSLQSGMHVLSGSGDEVGRQTPLRPFRRIFNDLLRIESRKEDLTLVDFVRIALSDVPGIEDRMPLLNTVLPISLPDTSFTAALAGKVRADRTFDLLIEILERHMRNGCLVLLLEDAHWIDPLSLALSVHIVNRIPRCLLAITTRTTDDNDDLRALAHDSRATHLVLDNLDQTSIVALVCRRLGVSELPRDVSEFVNAKAEGHPLFAEEVALALRDTGLLEVSNGRARLRVEGVRLDQLSFPGTIQGVISSRLDRLNPRQQLLLKVASVIGRIFPLAALENAFPESQHKLRLREDLEHLAQLDITPEQQAEKEVTYAFRHSLVRDVVYQQLLTVQRQQLHLAVGRWYEQTFESDLSPYYGVLAQHWREAASDPDASSEQVDKAVLYLRKAAAQTSDNAMPRAAVGFGLDAARLLGSDLSVGEDEVSAEIANGEAEIDAYISGHSIGTLCDLPPMTNLRSMRAAEVMLEIMPAAFMGRQAHLFALLGVTLLRLTLAHGNSPIAPIIYSMYAILRRNGQQDARSAHEFSKVALELDRRSGGHTLPVVAFIHTWFISFWLHPLRDSLELSLRAGNAGLAGSDIRYGCFCVSGYVLYSAAAGLPLHHVKQVAREQAAAINRRVLSSTFHCVIELQFAKALMGETQDHLSLTDDEYNEAQDLASICESDQYNQIAYYFTVRSKLNYYFGNFVEAVQVAAQAYELLPACAGQIAEMELRFFYAMACIARFKDLTGAECEQLKTRAIAEAKVLQVWQGWCESNFKHKSMLVSGGLAMIEHRIDDATKSLREAAALALQQGYLQDHAIALELIAECFDGDEGPGASAQAFEDAATAYERWNATAKAALLRKRVAAL